jgi:DNA modification methylase
MRHKPSAVIDTRVVWCGENLEKLKSLPDKCVDLVYIDPPFNSNRNYEVFWGETKEKRSFDDRHESTKAYIEFMRPRCVELGRVLKAKGSFYYHCDWHASHYIKVMLDQILGENNFQSEIAWKRTSSHNDSKKWAHIHDTLLFYAQPGFTWNPIFLGHDESYVKQFYRYEDERGKYRLDHIIRSASMGPRPNLAYEYKGYTPQWGWRTLKDKLKKLDADGRLQWSKTGRPYLKRYLHEQKGTPVSSFWDDIGPVQATARERIGFPTQKPLALLDRIIKASTNLNDIVLDAFCGCGTALESAQTAGRQWIGIDQSPTACRVMAKRLRDRCNLTWSESAWRSGRGFVVRELPWTEEQLRKLPHFEFENWAVLAIHGTPNQAQVGDMGIDGRIYPTSGLPEKGKDSEPELAFMDVWYPVQVKQSDKVGRPEIDKFEAVLMREKRTRGYFVAFSFSSDAMSEMNAFFKRTGREIIPFTVQQLLDEDFTSQRRPPASAPRAHANKEKINQRKKGVVWAKGIV